MQIYISDTFGDEYFESYFKNKKHTTLAYTEILVYVFDPFSLFNDKHLELWTVALRSMEDLHPHGSVYALINQINKDQYIDKESPHIKKFVSDIK